MKRFSIILILLLITALSFAQVEFSGSTEVSGVGNKIEQLLRVEQIINLSMGGFSFALDSFVYDWLFADKENAWDYEVEASYALGIFTFGAILDGAKDLVFSTAQPYLDIAIGSVGADVDILLSADKEKDVFQGAEFSAFWNPGPLSIRLGYMLVPEGGTNVDENTPEDLADGGLFGTVKVSY